MTAPSLTVRRAHPGDAAAIVTALHRSEGASHFAHWMYQPDLVARALHSGHIRSWVAVEPGGEVRAHAALITGNSTSGSDPAADAGPDTDGRAGAGAGPVLEYGLAFTDPDFRGRGLALQLGAHALAWAQQHHVGDVYSWTTTLRPFAQQGLRDAGAVEICLLLAMMPPGINRGFRHDIDQAAAAMLFVLPAGRSGNPRTWHVPAEVQRTTALLAEPLGITVTASSAPTGRVAGPAPNRSSAGSAEAGIAWSFFEPLRFGVIDLAAAPEATVAQVIRRTLALAQAGADVTYLDLSPESPEAMRMLPTLARHGFTYAGIHPDYGTGELRLRLQAVTCQLQPKATITTASERGRLLLDQVWAGLPQDA